MKCRRENQNKKRKTKVKVKIKQKTRGTGKKRNTKWTGTRKCCRRKTNETKQTIKKEYGVLEIFDGQMQECV